MCKETINSSVLKDKKWDGNLEWGDEYAKPAREGMLIGVKDGVFGICTRGQPGGVFQCPFGEVSSPKDLEIVRKAARHEPVSDVIIFNCGILINSDDKNLP